MRGPHRFRYLQWHISFAHIHLFEGDAALHLPLVLRPVDADVVHAGADHEADDAAAVIEGAAVARLLTKYADVPMSLADACLVRMAEQHTHSIVWTLDSDFQRYRKHGRQIIPTLLPNVH